jgi:hypothetical protein
LREEAAREDKKGTRGETGEGMGRRRDEEGREVDHFQELGFTKQSCVAALRQSKNRFEIAVDHLLTKGTVSLHTSGLSIPPLHFLQPFFPSSALPPSSLLLLPPPLHPPLLHSVHSLPSSHPHLHKVKPRYKKPPPLHSSLLLRSTLPPLLTSSPPQGEIAVQKTPTPPRPSTQAPPPALVNQLVDMGFTKEEATKALQYNNNDVDKAMCYLLGESDINEQFEVKI